VNLATAQRRALQPLWNALDAALLDRRCVLAVSGGPDSRALLESAARWPQRARALLCVLTIDHGVRGESAEEARRVVGRARALGLPATVVTLAPHRTDEATLRTLRHDALFDHARQNGCDAVVMAHHADDVAEGLWMSLLGTGGARAGIRSVVESVGVLLVRPFLSLRRTDLHAALHALDVRDVVQDPLDARGAGARAQVRALLASRDVDVAPLAAALADDLHALETQSVDAVVRAIVEAQLHGSDVDVRSARAGIATLARLVRAQKDGSVDLPGTTARLTFRRG
jgi:tRNA(Ile)-lysidine synthase